MNAMRLVGLWLLLVPLVGWAFPPLPKPKENTPPKGIAEAARGTWELTKVERGNGKSSLPAGYVLRLTIDGQKLTQTTLVNGREQRSIPSTFVVDAKKTPARFEMKYTMGKSKEVAIKGLLTINGDQMIWAYATGDGQVPAKIDDALGTMQHRFTLKRVKK